MQFAVPQFTDVEDKIIGPLTLKQFFVLLAAGGLCLFFWSMPIPKILAVIVDLPIALTGIALAFASYNGRPMLGYIVPFITYIVSPKSMIFQRERIASNANMVSISNKTGSQPPITVDQEAADSRLRKLAYLLDQKTKEEKKLLGQSESNTNKQLFKNE
jgi:hypothetical protein